MKNLTLLLALVSLSLLGCPGEDKSSLNEKRKELINDVGGAPKRTIDDAQKRVNDSMKKMQNRLEAETAGNE